METRAQKGVGCMMNDLGWILATLFGITSAVSVVAYLNASERAGQAEQDASDAEDELANLRRKLTLLLTEEDEP